MTSAGPKEKICSHGAVVRDKEIPGGVYQQQLRGRGGRGVPVEHPVSEAPATFARTIKVAVDGQHRAVCPGKLAYGIGHVAAEGVFGQSRAQKGGARQPHVRHIAGGAVAPESGELHAHGLVLIEGGVCRLRRGQGGGGGKGFQHLIGDVARTGYNQLPVRDDEGIQQHPGERRDQKRRVARGKAPWRLEKAFHADLLSMGQSIAALCVGRVNVD